MNLFIFIIALLVLLFVGCWVGKAIRCKQNKCCSWGFWPKLLSLLWIAFASWYYACHIKSMCSAPATKEVVQSTIVDPEPIQKTPKDWGPLTFGLSSLTPILGEGFDGYISNWVSKLQDGQNMVIRGQYFEDETNDSSFENLGLARANKIKEVVSQWIDPSRVILASDNLGAKPSNLPEFFSSIQFGFEAQPVAPSEPAPEPSFTAEMVGTKRIVYFDFAASNTGLAQDLKDYLQKVAQEAKELGKTVEVVGHTDNIGKLSSNYALGQRRAEMVKSVLVEYGLSQSLVRASSQGEEQPQATNDTSEGRAKNRRVEIEFK